MGINGKKIEYISIIGIDGSGKSTWSGQITDYLGENNKVVGVSDEISYKNDGRYRKKIIFKIWKFFWRASKRTKKKIFYKIIKITELTFRMKALKLVVKENPVDIVVSDGAPLINILAWGNIYYPKIFNDDLCTRVFKHLSGIEKVKFWDNMYYLRVAPEIFILNILHIRFFIPDVIIFLEISPKEAIDRINIRGKDLQFHETEDKLSKLQSGYYRVINLLENNFNIEIIKQNVDNLSISDNMKIIKNNFNL